MVIREPINIDNILEKVRAALSEGHWEEATSLLESLRPFDQAELFADLLPNEQEEILPRLDPQDSANILEELEDEEVAEIAKRMTVNKLALIVGEMEPDEAADLLGDIEPEHAEALLAKIDESEEVRSLLVHDDNSAGGMMTSLDVVIRADMTVEEAIAHLRRQPPDSEDIYYLFVEDDQDHLVGVVSLRQLVVAPSGTKLDSIMDRNPICVFADADQEEAANLMKHYDLLALPVTDHSNHLLGMITYDDSFDILEEEATKDIYRLGGVLQEQPADVSVPLALRSRLPWLLVNMATALISVAVLSFFEGTISQLAALAAFFPIVTGVCGSAGTQTLTVTVRGLALGDLESDEAFRTLRRELLIGLLNGLTIGLVVVIIAVLWKGPALLGLVAGAAVFFNMIWAAAAGVLVPFVITKLKIDPALASPTLVMTSTDTMGYLIFLGLATWFITAVI
ncbi:MAG: magnesium transporter [Chloroflexota bacterium]